MPEIVVNPTTVYFFSGHTNPSPSLSFRFVLICMAHAWSVCVRIRRTAITTHEYFIYVWKCVFFSLFFFFNEGILSTCACISFFNLFGILREIINMKEREEALVFFFSFLLKTKLTRRLKVRTRLFSR